MKVYVRGKSLKEVNTKLEEGRVLLAREYSLLRHGIEFALGQDVPDGTQVAVFKRIQNGFPYAHVFGEYSASQNRLVRGKDTTWSLADRRLDS